MVSLDLGQNAMPVALLQGSSYTYRILLSMVLGFVNGSISSGLRFYSFCSHKCFRSSYTDPINVKFIVLPHVYLAYKYLLNNSSNVTIFIPTLPHLENTISNFVKFWKVNTIVSSNVFEIENNFKIANRALVCSGTASLEIAKSNIPQLVIYKLNIITEFIVKLFIKIKYANIINIIENKMIIPEITNSKLNNNIFLHEFNKLIIDENANSLQIKNINNTLRAIQADKPPYLLAANRIISYL